jgi:WhiB family transcriptional regulator, redox-sensing transcriptional regulator
MSVDGEWRMRAACGSLDARVADAVFYPPQDAHRRYVRARLVCGGCPVRRECLVDALVWERRIGDLKLLHGMRGGLSAPERARLIRAERERKGVAA